MRVRPPHARAWAQCKQPACSHSTSPREEEGEKAVAGKVEGGTLKLGQGAGISCMKKWQGLRGKGWHMKTPGRQGVALEGRNGW